MYEQSTTQPTMTTQVRPRNAAGGRKHIDDAALACAMTRNASVPLDCRALYDVRRGRRKLTGMYPEMAINLARHGHKPADILSPLHAIEQRVLSESSKRLSISLADAMREEAEAEGLLNIAELEACQHPNDKTFLETLEERAYGQEIATQILILKVHQMREGL